MGVEQTLEVLHRCLAMGADQAILLNDARFAVSDTYATSYIVSAAIKKIDSADIVACGAKSLDGETGQVPVGIATRLNMAYLSHVEKMVTLSEGYAVIDTVGLGKRDRVRVQLPLVTIFDQFELVEPMVSLFSLKRSKHLQPVIWDADDLGVDCAQIGQGGSKTKVINVKKVTRAAETIVLEGTVDMKSTYLRNLIIGDYSVTSI
jgi:electron transfer flavoprotein beta subunit